MTLAQEKENAILEHHSKPLTLSTLLPQIKQSDWTIMSLDENSASSQFSHDDSNEENLQLRMQFLELTDQDREELKRLIPLFHQFGDRFVKAFYEHLFRFDETSQFLQQSELVERLKQAQKAHFLEMLEANWGESYAADRKRVGTIHANAGIVPHVFLGSYNQYAQFCFPLFEELLKTENTNHEAQSLTWILPLLKVIFLDIGLTLDSYFAQHTQNLRDALEMYWEANNELRQFARLASHDIKTPLATVANLCEEALDEFGAEIPEEAQELISGAQQRIHKIGHLLDELLNFPMEGTSQETLEEFPMQRAIEEAVERVLPSFKERDIQLQLPQHYPFVFGNKIRLREVIYNLLANAAKFVNTTLAQGESKVALTITESEETCIICIADNGPGIPQSELPRIFAPFARLPQHQDIPGSGLGLYFAKSLMEKQHGHIWATSILGKGTQFYLQLYLRDPTISTE